MSFKSAKVVMLPTEKASNICLSNKGNLQLLLDNSSKNTNNHFEGIYQHLYITSDDEIKEDDWYIWLNNNQICKAEEMIMTINHHIKNGHIKKIIATTDESLNIENPRNGIIHSLPQPSQSFIERYVESYNNGKPIVDVVVEYEEFTSPDNLQNTEYFDSSFYQNELKINPKDNTITIKRIKNSYSRDELEKLCRLSWSAGINHESLARRGFKQEASSYFIDNWIKQNL